MEREKIIFCLTGAKRFVLKALVIIVISSAAGFIFFKPILGLLLKTVHIKVYYFTLPEVFLSSVELAIYSGIFFALPIVVFLLCYEFRHIKGLKSLERYLLAISFVILFYTGSTFCYFIVLKSGIEFLLSYEGNALKAMISIEKFVKFSAAMMFAFGITFEVPVFLIMLNKMGILKVATLTKTRRYAILFIAIASAVITPTPDVYNMMLLAVPTYVLYEAGILFMKIRERKAKLIVDQ
jgi:sec-independent protein translocase protein TatC